MDQFSIDSVEDFKSALAKIKNEHPQVGVAIEYAQTLICSKPFESGFVVGRDGWRYFTTESIPRFIVFFYVDESRNAIW